MKLIKSNFEILEQEPGLDGIYKAIERAGRTCYRSQDKITEDSAKKFVDMCISRGHTAVLEQSTVYLQIPYNRLQVTWIWDKYEYNPYSKVIHNSGRKTIAYVTTNYRVLYENGWLDDLKYLCEPTEYHAKRVTVKFICDRGVSHELVRHRVFSFAQESTRYCNYSKDKFGNELTFISKSLGLMPGHINPGEDIMHSDYWSDCTCDGIDFDAEADLLKLELLQKCEETYIKLILEHYHTPQQARAILPNALKTEVVMTGFIDDWEHFFDLRCDKASHPDMRALAIPLKEEFIKRGYIK